MKKIYEEDLCHKTNGQIDWLNSLGKFVRFDIDGYKDTFQIVNVQGHNITVLFNGEEITVENHSLKKGNGLLKIVGLWRNYFAYEENDIINGFLILRKERQYGGEKSNSARKMYYYECIKCHHKGWKSEKDLRKCCPVCEACELIDPEINSLKIKKPYIYSLVTDDNKDIMAPCSGLAHWKCPECNQINYSKLGDLKDDVPLPCKFCGDGISFPEKMLYNFMYQITKDFEMQKTFIWSGKKKYDYYDNGIFIEIHGNQHYEKDFSSCGGKTLDEEKKNDEIKEKLAKNFCADYIDYIIINASKSDFEFIKNNLLNSRIKEYYDISNVNWDIIKKNCYKSFIIRACEMFNNNTSVSQIADVLKKSKYTIRKYLRQGTALQLCDYEPRDYRKNSLHVRCINTNQIFKDAAEAAKWCGLKYHSPILEQAKGVYNYAGIHPSTGEKLKWEIVNQ